MVRKYSLCLSTRGRVASCFIILCVLTIIVMRYGVSDNLLSTSVVGVKKSVEEEQCFCHFSPNTSQNICNCVTQSDHPQIPSSESSNTTVVISEPTADRATILKKSYKNICYLTVKEGKECTEICRLDSLCYYSYYYPSEKSSNCFTQLFYNQSQPDCMPYLSSDAVRQVKAELKHVNLYINSTIMDAASCRKPNYHPYDPALTGITDRRPITQQYHCRKKINRRFKVAEDNISLTTSLANGESCRFRYIYRSYDYAKTDEAVSFTDWFSLTAQPTELTGEFAEIVCRNSKTETYRDYLSYVPRKLAKQRSEQASKRNKVQEKSRRFSDKISILMFGIDSTSLSQGYRHLPRVLGYLRQNHHVITFKGYNRLQDNTFMNLYTVLTGKPVEEGIGISFNRYFDDDPLIFKWFNNDNFVTGYYEDYKTGALFNWLKKGFHYKPSDHYSKPFATVIEPKVAPRWWEDFCYIDKGMHVWEGDWTSSFVKQYSKLNYPYFLWSWTTMIAHESANSLGQSDVYYYNLFRDLDKSDSLNNTILVFYSDHGYRYGGLRSTKVGQHEENSPMMHWIIPEWFQSKYAKEMEIFRVNAERRLTSPYDLHRTLLDFADGALASAKDGGMKDFGKSFFEPIDDKRTCADAGISDHFCGCRSSKEHPMSDELTQKAAEAIVDRVNNLTSVNRELCLVYKLRYIKSAYLNQRHDIQDKNLKELLVTIGMRPSDAEFSATVHLYLDGSKKADVKGISRVSLYGQSANCVQDFEMRLYCSCKKLTKLD